MIVRPLGCHSEHWYGALPLLFHPRGNSSRVLFFKQNICYFCGNKNVLTFCVKVGWEIWVFPKVKGSYAGFHHLFIHRHHSVSHSSILCSSSRWCTCVPGGVRAAEGGLCSSMTRSEKNILCHQPSWPYQENGMCAPSSWLNKSHLNIQDETKPGGQEESWRSAQDLDLAFAVRIIGGFYSQMGTTLLGVHSLLFVFFQVRLLAVFLMSVIWKKHEKLILINRVLICMLKIVLSLLMFMSMQSSSSSSVFRSKQCIRNNVNHCPTAHERTVSEMMSGVLWKTVQFHLIGHKKRIITS